MSNNRSKRKVENLEKRRKAYESLSSDKQKATKKPGSRKK